MAKKKDYDNKKDFIIRVRVTPAEHNEFMKRAKEKRAPFMPCSRLQSRSALPSARLSV